ncbi:FadR/GntR family transcriptional regulator [Pedobacter sp. AW31-3R]|uniref:FadR/GntR family transcriptional regulator n=1 Tax=Pedobacter sp. AW31-3R TaxID=3445781 RepID=UPI003F9F7F9E
MENLIDRKNLSEVVAQRLSEMIRSGEYKLEQKLPIESDLMKQFGVGRSSIREAVRTLENSGMLRVQQGIGTFVASQNAMTEPLAKRLQTAGLADMQEVRELLEMKIVEKAAINRTAEDLVLMKSLLELRNKAADHNNLQDWLEADINFHMAIADASKNIILTELYKTFIEQQLKKSIADTYSQQIPLHRFTALHKKLLDCIVDQDPRKAVKVVVEMHHQE